MKHGKPQKIPLYKKANWDTFAQELQKTADEIKEIAPTSTINELWSNFKMAIETGIQKHIPSKVSKTKDNLLYNTRN